MQYTRNINLIYCTQFTVLISISYFSVKEKKKNPSLQLLRNDFTSLIFFIRYFAFQSFSGTLRLNKILCPIVTVSWRSFNFHLLQYCFRKQTKSEKKPDENRLWDFNVSKFCFFVVSIALCGSCMQPYNHCH